MRARREFLAVAGTALLFVVLAPVFWFAVESPGGDAATVAPGESPLDALMPAAHYADARLRTGELPLWWSDAAFGVPFHAIPTHGPFSPARILDLAMAPATALAAQSLIFLLLSALTMLLFLRGLDVSWTGALPGAMAYSFSGSMAAAMSIPGAGAAYAIGPLLLWGAYVTVARGEVGGLWCSGVALGLCMLCGSVDKPLAFWAMASLWMALLCPFLRGRPRWRRWLVWCAGTLCIALLIAAVQVVPALSWGWEIGSLSAVLLSPAVPGSVPGGAWGLVWHLLQPQVTPAPPLGFIGAALAWLAIPALAGWRRRAESWGLALLAALLALAAITDAARDLPLLSVSLLLYLLPLPMASLAAIGAARLFAPGADPRAREAWLPVLAAVLVWLALLVVSGGHARGWLLVAGCVVAPALLFRWRWLGALSAIALAAVAFVELSNASKNLYGHPFFTQRGEPPASREASPVLARARELALDGRVLLLGAETAADLLLPARLLGIKAIGHSSATPAYGGTEWWKSFSLESEPVSVEELNANPSLRESLKHMNVRVLIERLDGQPGTAAEGFRAAGTYPPYGIFVQETPARIYWGNPEEVDEAESTVTMGDWGHPLPPSATWRVEADAPEKLALQVDAPTPGLLAVAGRATAGWTASIDGETVPLLTANGMARAVAVPQGAHLVEFRYRPWALFLGFGISAVAMLSSCIGILYEVIRRRPLI